MPPNPYQSPEERKAPTGLLITWKRACLGSLVLAFAFIITGKVMLAAADGPDGEELRRMANGLIAWLEVAFLVTACATGIGWMLTRSTR